MPGSYILCVDDEALIVESIRQELKRSVPGPSVETALSGAEALSVLDELGKSGKDLAVLITDERMPGMPGHQLLREVRDRQPGAYGILLTGYADVDAIAGAVNDAGLFRFLQKPWNRADLAMAVRRALDLFEREREIVELRQRIERLNLSIVAALENGAHEGDPDTVGHVQRVACYAAMVGRRLGLGELEVRKLFLYAPLHDIGKCSVPQRILAKPGRLDPAEFEVVKQHVASGLRLIDAVDIDPMARDLILYHHERWDGLGYLARLGGEDIPLPARIVALADVLDAMVEARPYKPARPFDEVAHEILGMAGGHFDPRVVEAFEAELDALRSVSEGRIPPEFDLSGLV